jgi:hypothetical protein
MLFTASKPLAWLIANENRVCRRYKPRSFALPQPRPPAEKPSETAAADLCAGALLVASTAAAVVVIAWVGREVFSQLSSLPLHDLLRVFSGT